MYEFVGAGMYMRGVASPKAMQGLVSILIKMKAPLGYSSKGLWSKKDHCSGKRSVRRCSAPRSADTALSPKPGSKANWKNRTKTGLTTDRFPSHSVSECVFLFWQGVLVDP